MIQEQSEKGGVTYVTPAIASVQEAGEKVKRQEIVEKRICVIEGFSSETLQRLYDVLKGVPEIASINLKDLPYPRGLKQLRLVIRNQSVYLIARE